VPSVARFSVTPVKGLALHHPEEILLQEFGVAADRRFYLVREDGRLFSGLHHGPLVQVRADWEEETDRLGLAFPDGKVVEDVVRLGEPVVTDFWGRRVSGRAVLGPWDEALGSFVGKRLRLVKGNDSGAGFDAEPVTLVSEASVEELGRRAGRDAVDGRRFRMLIDLAGCSAHEEDSWAGRSVRFGEAVVEVLGPVPRCATTTRDPGTGIRDFDTLRAIEAYRGRRDEKDIDFGVYARVLEAGRIKVGDSAEPL
jgi:MOSC domain-containing protein